MKSAAVMRITFWLLAIVLCAFASETNGATDVLEHQTNNFEVQLQDDTQAGEVGQDYKNSGKKNKKNKKKKKTSRKKKAQKRRTTVTPDTYYIPTRSFKRVGLTMQKTTPQTKQKTTPEADQKHQLLT